MNYKIGLLAVVLFTVFACKEEAKKEEVVEQTETSETMEKKENDWKILFDGTTTDAFRGYQEDSIYAQWSIEDDALAFTPGGEGNKDIITKEKFTNFILSLEWKVSEGGNSGIFWGVHEDDQYGEAYMTGPEIQVLDNERHPDAKVAEGTHKAGSLYDMIACPDEHVNPAGEWNLCVIEINQDGNEAKVSMNGTQVMTFPLHGEKWDAMVADSKFTAWEGFGKYRTGHIALQDHGDKVWYRNIKIKEL
ncbi:MAG: 3-keto-disaccharide hydrolase [bacterium]